MGSPESRTERGGWARELLSAVMLLGVVAPVIAITSLHYFTSHEHQWVHDILRRAYYLPIVVAAVRTGLTGGLITSLAVTGLYLPHAFWLEHHFDPARGLEKILEMALYVGVALVAGKLSDSERRRRRELQRAMEEQRRLTEQLIRAERLAAIGEVVAGIAHEIKTPLHALSGTAEVVDDLIPVDAEERGMWEIHKDEIRRLGKVSERFLSFAGPDPIEPVPMDLRSVARRLVELIGTDARKRGVRIEARLPAEVKVLGDEDRLAQVAMNIAVNGMKAMGDAGGLLTVEVGEAAHSGGAIAFLRIGNDGPMLKEGEIDRIFEPFRGDEGGTGLGLSISSRIVEQHAGVLSAYNGDNGPIFEVRLRVHPDA